MRRHFTMARTWLAVAIGAAALCGAAAANTATGPASQPATDPGHGIAAAHGPATRAGRPPLKRPLDRRPPIDINTAPVAELRTLPGIGPEEAARIVAARPFLTKTNLVTRQVIPAGVYLQIKYRIVAMQHGQPRAKARG